MAMNKSERAEVDALREQLAFRWPTEAEPLRTTRVSDSIPKVEGYGFNAHTGLVQRMWSTRASHGYFYQDGRESGGSQQSKALYETARDAHIALRWAMCRLMAGQLYAADRRAAHFE